MLAGQPADLVLENKVEVNWGKISNKNLRAPHNIHRYKREEPGEGGEQSGKSTCSRIGSSIKKM